METLHSHIVLTDVVKPVINDVEFTATLRESHPKIKAVVISGYSDFEYVRATFQGGSIDDILKPTLNPQILLETMHGVTAHIPGLTLGRGKGSPEKWLGWLLSGFLQEDGTLLRETLPEESSILVRENVGLVFDGDKTAAENQVASLKRCAS